MIRELNRLGLSCRIDMMVQRLTSVNKGEIYEVVRTLISVLDLQLEGNQLIISFHIYG